MNHVGNNLWTRWRLRPCKKRAISSPGGIIPNRQAFPSTGYKHLFFVQRKSKCSQASDVPRQYWFTDYRTISKVVAFTLRVSGLMVSDVPREQWFTAYRTISRVVALTLEGLWTDGFSGVTYRIDKITQRTWTRLCLLKSAWRQDLLVFLVKEVKEKHLEALVVFRQPVDGNPSNVYLNLVTLAGEHVCEDDEVSRSVQPSPVVSSSLNYISNLKGVFCFCKMLQTKKQNCRLRKNTHGWLRII